MTHRQRRWLTTGLSWLVGLTTLGAACPRGASTSIRPCASDGDCPSGHICHPIGKVCVEACSAGTTCPESQANCAVVGPPDGGGPTVCKCETDVLCGTGYVCNLNVDDQCELACTSNGDCTQFGSNRKCETGTGKCVLQTCIDNPSLCPSGTTCDPISKQCLPGNP